MNLKSFALKLISFAFFLTAIMGPHHLLASEKTPKVVVSITPFYGLVAALMDRVETPILLTKPGASPHHYSLKPSELQRLNDADIIFWGGPALESFLIKSIENRKSTPHTHIIQLDQTRGLILLPLRRNIDWSVHSDHHSDDENTGCHHSHFNPHEIDMHFWLDPHNAIILANHMFEALSKVDPNHSEIYQQNFVKLKARLKQLDMDITAKLKSVLSVPYVTFHDAYQYFDHRYKLHSAGAITLHPEMPPSVQRLTAIQNIIQKTKARCVFTEPQFPPKLARSIAADLHVKLGQLDPIGSEANHNSEGYFKLLEDLSTSLKKCLEP